MSKKDIKNFWKHILAKFSKFESKMKLQNLGVNKPIEGGEWILSLLDHESNQTQKNGVSTFFDSGPTWSPDGPWTSFEKWTFKL